MNRYLLDTSVLSQPIKDSPVRVALERWSRCDQDALHTSAICVAELLQGLEARSSANYWRRYRELIEGHYPVVPFDVSVAAVYGQLHHQLKKLGSLRPVLDLLIAATARHHGLVVATLNIRHFRDIPAVQAEDWSIPL